MNFFKISEVILSQIVDAALRGAGSAVLPIVDSIRKAMDDQLQEKKMPELSEAPEDTETKKDGTP